MFRKPTKALTAWLAGENHVSQTYDFAVPEEQLNELHRQAELYLDGTVKLALAADSRATTLTNIFSAAAAGSLAVAANLVAHEHPPTSLIRSIVCSAVALFVAGVYCAIAARPRDDFYVPGFQPKDIIPIDGNDKSIKIASLNDIQRRIDANTRTLRAAGLTIKRGQIIALLAPAIFVATYLFL